MGNDALENDIDVLPPTEGSKEKFRGFVVGKAIQGMMNRRSTGPSGVAAEMFEAAEGEGREEMTALSGS